MTEKTFLIAKAHFDPDATNPETWDCVDCGTNTAPGMLGIALGRAQFRRRAQALRRAGDDC